MIAYLSCELVLFLLFTLWAPTVITVAVYSLKGDARSRHRLPSIWLFQLCLVATFYAAIEFFSFREPLEIMLVIVCVVGVIGTFLLILLHQFDVWG